MTIRKKATDAPTLPGAQPPETSGTTEGTPERSLGQELKDGAAGVQVAPELAEVAEVDTELAEASDEPMVTYEGDFTRREIRPEDWKLAGVQDMPYVVWERRTGHRVPANVFSDQALQVLRQDPDFRVP